MEGGTELPDFGWPIDQTTPGSGNSGLCHRMGSYQVSYNRSGSYPCAVEKILEAYNNKMQISLHSMPEAPAMNIAAAIGILVKIVLHCCACELCGVVLYVIYEFLLQSFRL